MCDEGYHELAKAIILQAIKDFEPAYLWLNGRSQSSSAASISACCLRWTVPGC